MAIFVGLNEYKIEFGLFKHTKNREQGDTTLIMKKRIAILGSTGSIGTQALEVILDHPDKFEVEVLAANNSAELLIDQAVQFVPNVVVIGNTEKYQQVKDALENFPIKVYTGEDAICQVVEMETIDHGTDRHGWFCRFASNDQGFAVGETTSLWPTKKHWWLPANLLPRLA